jgi:hypothetical protein
MLSLLSGELAVVTDIERLEARNAVAELFGDARDSLSSPADTWVVREPFSLFHAFCCGCAQFSDARTANRSAPGEIARDFPGGCTVRIQVTDHMPAAGGGSGSYRGRIANQQSDGMPCPRTCCG